MGHSKAEKAQSRERILSAAAIQIREAGIEGISVGALMKSVNLTHGGFYGHFASRNALIAAALEQALADGEKASAAQTAARGTKSGRASVKSIVNSYLSPAHRDHPGTGCAIPTLIGEVSRAEPEVSAIMAERLGHSFETMAEAFGGAERSEQFAVSAWSMMIGAMMISRALGDDPRADQVLASARKSILELETLYKSPSDNLV